MTGTDHGESGGKGQTEMLQEERQMENDRCELDDVGENHKGGEAGAGAGHWIDISKRGIFFRLRADSDCDEHCGVDSYNTPVQVCLITNGVFKLEYLTPVFLEQRTEKYGNKDTLFCKGRNMLKIAIKKKKSNKE